MKRKYFFDWILLALVALLVCARGIFSPVRCAIITTYSKHYSDSARVHENRRYHPDSMNVAVGWRELYGAVLWLEVPGALPLKVRAKDVMNKRYDDADELHVDASPAVMKALGLRGKSAVIVTVDIEWLNYCALKKSLTHAR